MFYFSCDGKRQNQAIKSGQCGEKKILLSQKNLYPMNEARKINLAAFYNEASLKTE